jgi:hypothetical protein
MFYDVKIYSTKVMRIYKHVTYSKDGKNNFKTKFKFVQPKHQESATISLLLTSLDNMWDIELFQSVKAIYWYIQPFKRLANPFFYHTGMYFTNLMAGTYS